MVISGKSIKIIIKNINIYWYSKLIITNPTIIIYIYIYIYIHLYVYIF